MTNYKRLKDNITTLHIHAITCKPVTRITNGKTTETHLVYEIIKDVNSILEKIDNKTLVELPCKVGQTVYYISFGKVYKGKCHAITLKPTMQIHLYDYDGDNASISADRVFLTKEEAEAALKEREGK